MGPGSAEVIIRNLAKPHTKMREERPRGPLPKVTPTVHGQLPEFKRYMSAKVQPSIPAITQRGIAPGGLDRGGGKLGPTLVACGKAGVLFGREAGALNIEKAA